MFERYELVRLRPRLDRKGNAKGHWIKEVAGARYREWDDVAARLEDEVDQAPPDIQYAIVERSTRNFMTQPRPTQHERDERAAFDAAPPVRRQVVTELGAAWLEVPETSEPSGSAGEVFHVYTSRTERRPVGSVVVFGSEGSPRSYHVRRAGTGASSVHFAEEDALKALLDLT